MSKKDKKSTSGTSGKDKKSKPSGKATSSFELKVVASPRLEDVEYDKKTSKNESSPTEKTSGTGIRAFQVFEKRKHPRFLLSREQFRENKTGKIFPVYDLSQNGLSLKVDEKVWPVGSVVTGILNLHPESIEVTPRLIAYYGDRAALKLEVVSTYARSVLAKALSPHRLGSSLNLVKEKLPLADYWYHGVCNTDLLIRLNAQGALAKIEVFFANYYWSWTESSEQMATGVCQSFGKERREDLLLVDEPVMIDSIELSLDKGLDSNKVQWAKGILQAAPILPLLKEAALKKF